MAGFEDFEDRDWRETLAELRVMVAGAGFGDWDAQAASALEDEVEGRSNSREHLLAYARSFEAFLKVRSIWSLKRMRAGLGEVLRDEEGRSIISALFVETYGDRVNEVLDGRGSDHVLTVINAFANAVGGETGYFDGEEIEG
jgi:hypothetical protein